MGILNRLQSWLSWFTSDPVGFLVYQIGTLITTGAFGAGFLPGVIAVTVMAVIVIELCIRADKAVKAGK